MKSWLDQIFLSPVKRRKFMKWGTAAGGVAAVAGAGLPLKSIAQTGSEASPEKKTTWSACMVNCGSRCPLQVHTEDGVITSVESDNFGDDSEFGQHQIRACLRGRSIKHRLYNPDRLKYPMKRVGARGEARFERISWDEALDLMADKLKYTIKEYGNESIFFTYGSGTQGYRTDGPFAMKRLVNMIGGYLNYHGNYSWGQIQFALPYTYGTLKSSAFGSYTSEIEKAELLVMFGYNPAETRMSGGGEIYEHTEAVRKKGVRTIIIDPRYTDTMLGKEDEWIPIRPGTDAALVEGIAHVLLKENLVDQAFLDKFCQGYDEKTLPDSAPANGHYKAHILGQGEDGIEKTPEWASRLTGIPAKKIIQLAREIGSAKPAYIVQGSGIQRQANGEQASRAIVMLPILTGNIGLPGTHTGDMPANFGYPVPTLPTGTNPVKAAVSFFNWSDAIFRAEEMTDKTDGIQGVERLKQNIKFMISYAGNALINQHSDINKTTRIMKDESLVEFIVVVDNHMTPSARFADLLLPDVTTKLEKIAEEWILPEGDVISALPKYVTTWESHLDPLTDKYPLQLVGFHTKGRVHSTYHNVAVLREAVMDGVWINPMDAKTRGIENGDRVRLWNDRGETRVLAKVTPRIMPGVMALGEGAWYKPDRQGVDHGGAINMLTSQRPTPLSKGNPQHTNLVEIAKV